MFEWFLDFPLRPGYQVAWVLATLICLIVLIGLSQFRRRRRVASHAALPGERIENPVLVSDAPSASALTKTLESLEKYSRLQASLRERLEHTRAQAELTKVHVESTAQLLRQSASEMRLPHVVHEIYQSLRSLPKKSLLVQQADRDWHQMVGVEPGPVLVLDAAAAHYVVDFTCFGRPLRVTCRTFKLSRSTFDELSLFDGQDHPVLTSRVFLDQQRLHILDATVSMYRPGPWVDVLLDSRALIDERRETLLLHSQYRELEKMRDDFGLNGSLKRQRSET